MPSSNASPFIWQVKCHRVELVEEDDQIKMKSVLIAMVATRSFGKSTYCVMFTLLQRWGRQSAELCGGTLSSVMAILVHLPEWDWGACLVNTSSHWSSSEFPLALLYLATLEIRWMWSNITRSIYTTMRVGTSSAFNGKILSAFLSSWWNPTGNVILFLSSR